MLPAADEILMLDPNRGSRDALTLALSAAGYRLGCFIDPNALVAALARGMPACLLVDAAEFSSLSQSKLLADVPQMAPLLVLCDGDHLQLAMEAIADGACGYIERPVITDAAVARVGQAIGQRKRPEVNPRTAMSAEWTLHLDLTAREREILVEVARGASSKEIGRLFKISPRTVEVHRAKIMEKLGAKNTAELMRIMLAPAATDRS